MKIFLIIIMIGLGSCVYDKKQKVVAIQNKSKKNIVALITTNFEITDDELFYRSKTSIQHDSSGEILTMNIPPASFSLFIFNEDSVYQHIIAGTKKGIVEKSFITKYRLSRDSINNAGVLIFKDSSKNLSVQ